MSDGSTPGARRQSRRLPDISLLGANYGIRRAHGVRSATWTSVRRTDYSVNGRPTTDNDVNFEDLILFAINYGQVGFTGEQPGLAVGPDFEGETGRVRLELGPTPGSVKAGQIVRIPILLHGDVEHVRRAATVLCWTGTLLAYEECEVASEVSVRTSSRPCRARGRWI